MSEQTNNYFTTIFLLFVFSFSTYLQHEKPKANYINIAIFQDPLKYQNNREYFRNIDSLHYQKC